MSDVKEIVDHRAAAYGDPEDNFKRIADKWNAQGLRAYNKHDNSYRMIRASDVGLAMIDVKMARQAHANNDDNILDIEGYKKCVQRCLESEEALDNCC